jgi:hypothetical protein
MVTVELLVRFTPDTQQSFLFADGTLLLSQQRA